MDPKIELQKGEVNHIKREFRKHVQRSHLEEIISIQIREIQDALAHPSLKAIKWRWI